MTRPASESLSEIHARLDARVRRVDEERWLSSRYAAESQRCALTVLYAFYFELARVRLSVSDQTLGQIRYQWWRDALAELGEGQVREHDVVLALNAEIEAGRVVIAALQAMVDQHEASFLSSDRDQEPEPLLARTAAGICDSEHEAGVVIDSVAADWARLRRGAGPVADIKPISIGSGVRPALAHFRLRRAWAGGRQPGPLALRLSILRAVLTGRI